jgi:hypothetical protein
MKKEKRKEEKWVGKKEHKGKRGVNASWMGRVKEGSSWVSKLNVEWMKRDKEWAGCWLSERLRELI